MLLEIYWYSSESKDWVIQQESLFICDLQTDLQIKKLESALQRRAF